MPRIVKRLILLTLTIAIVGVLYVERVRILDMWRVARTPQLPLAVTYAEVQPPVPAPVPVPVPTPVPAPVENPTPTPVPAPSPAPSTVPATFNLAVPFTPQAPFALWDEFHKETCEEAVLYMVHRFYEGDPPGILDPNAVEKELRHVAAFEDSVFGFNKDTTVAQTGVIAEQLYGYDRVKVFANPTVEQIKALVAAGYPVIVPAAGQQLGNPYFTAPGPVYHMLLIRGYTANGFITNDPGTRHGEGFVYSFDVLMNAMHDWNAEDITKGAKVVLVVYPNLPAEQAGTP